MIMTMMMFDVHTCKPSSAWRASSASRKCLISWWSNQPKGSKVASSVVFRYAWAYIH